MRRLPDFWRPLPGGAYVRFLRFEIDEDLVLSDRVMNELLGIIALKGPWDVDRSSVGLFLSQIITLGQVQFHPIVSPILRSALTIGSPGDRLLVVPVFVQESALPIAVTTVAIARKLSHEQVSWEQRLSAVAPEVGNLRAMLQAQFSSTMNLVLGRIWERGGPISQLSPYMPFFQIGEGVRARLYHRNTSHDTSFVGSEISIRKDLCNALFTRMGLPVAKQMIVSSAEMAQAAARQIGFPVVVKPLAGGQGRAVFAHLDNEKSVAEAWNVASTHGAVIVENHCPGEAYRFTVINGKLASARRQVPPFVVGDGKRSVEELLEEVNQKRSRDPNYLSYSGADLSDPAAVQTLLEQGKSPQSVPDEGERVWIRRNSNLSTGGLMEDWTDRVHPNNARLAEAAAKAVDIDICGVDLLLPDATRSWHRAGGVICEVNATAATRHDIAVETIADYLLGERQGRVPKMLLVRDKLSSWDEQAIEDAFFARFPNGLRLS